MTRANASRKPGRRGQALVEFAMTAVVVLTLILFVVEVARIFLVYTTVTNAAREGARYAITHGTISGGTATNTDVSNMQSSVQTIVRGFLAVGTVGSTGLSIVTSFPSISCASGTPGSTCTGTTPGNLVQVTVSYPYDLLISYFPINVNVSGTSEGVITW